MVNIIQIRKQIELNASNRIFICVIVGVEKSNQNMKMAFKFTNLIELWACSFSPGNPGSVNSVFMAQQILVM